MRKLTALLIAIIFVFGISVAVFAQMPGQGQKGPSGAKTKAGLTFEDRKANFLSIIDERIKILQDAKACVTAAKTPTEMQKCRQQIRAEQKELRQDIKEGKKK
ncbi:MAG: hypothetical protein LLF28_07685 [Nitrospiraceae bacterium]|nr:hypothetical protein [Nitrospiraceae bacterium]